MATIEDDLRAFLITKSAITTLLATTNSIRTGKEPEKGDRPFIRITLLGMSITHATGNKNHAVASIKIDCEGDTRTVARNIAKQVRLNLDGHRGTLSAVHVQFAFLQNMQDAPVELIAGDEYGLPSTEMLFSIGYNQETS